jgi:uncharacterized protein
LNANSPLPIWMPMPPTDSKRLAVVTGASDGIGYELAKVFAQNGFDLVVCAEDGGIVEAAQAFEQLGVKVTTVQADLATHEGVEQLWARIRDLNRPIDAAAINAGVGVGGEFAKTDLQAELNLINLNVTSTVHLAKYVVQQMVSLGSGRILFSSSIASTMPAPFEAVYGASKAFVQSFSQALRNELKDTGVSVTALMPGPTETNFFHRAGLDDTKVGASEKDDAGKVALDGFEALMAGKDHVVAGSFKNKAQALGAKALPETAKAQIHRGMAEPGSADK